MDNNNISIDSPEFEALRRCYLEDWEELNKDPEFVKKIKREFAKVGLFGAEVHADTQKMGKALNKGIKLSNKNFWLIDKWGQCPLVALRIKRKVRGSSANFEVIEDISPLKLTPHSIEQYRRRSGYWINTDMMWNIPYIPTKCIETIDGNAFHRKDIMLPILIRVVKNKKKIRWNV